MCRRISREICNVIYRNLMVLKQMYKVFTKPLSHRKKDQEQSKVKNNLWDHSVYKIT